MRKRMRCQARAAASFRYWSAHLGAGRPGSRLPQPNLTGTREASASIPPRVGAGRNGRPQNPGQHQLFMRFVNLTPHVVRLNDGSEIAPSGTVARVSSRYSDFDANGVASVSFGEVTGLPPAEEGTLFVASAIVAQAAKRHDVVSPATGHPDAKRENGQIVSVPGFVRAA